MKQGVRGKEDKNFDALFERFRARIYGTKKGEWRLKLLQEDLEGLLESKEALEVWDAGCGLGQMSCLFAKKGHKVVANDISKKMLEAAQKECEGVKGKIHFYHVNVKEIAPTIAPQDLVLFHAVIEWTAKPMEALETVASKVKRGGYLSLLFYNYHSFIWRNALKAQWRLGFILDERNWYGKGRKLTPPHPQKPEAIREKLVQMGFEPVRQTGIRIFHDYIDKEALKQSDPEALFALEYKYARTMPYPDMARYVHILAKRK